MSLSCWIFKFISNYVNHSAKFVRNKQKHVFLNKYWNRLTKSIINTRNKSTNIWNLFYHRPFFKIIFFQSISHINIIYSKIAFFASLIKMVELWWGSTKNVYCWPCWWVLVMMRDNILLNKPLPFFCTHTEKKTVKYTTLEQMCFRCY